MSTFRRPQPTRALIVDPAPGPCKGVTGVFRARFLPISRALLIGASWLLSLAVAEYFIHRRAQATAGKPRAAVQPA
ncbi:MULTISPECIES: hypothetical protein [unclassified Pseudarthrobacter]|uniref:hypothetical protein n=1 Tax=unclassified Pseudarthrobacter TaxID=2647000 RepID=UPI00362A7C4D